jgi:hypothetical protein
MYTLTHFSKTKTGKAKKSWNFYFEAKMNVVKNAKDVSKTVNEQRNKD